MTLRITAYRVDVTDFSYIHFFFIIMYGACSFGYENKGRGFPYSLPFSPKKAKFRKCRKKRKKRLQGAAADAIINFIRTLVANT